MFMILMGCPYPQPIAIIIESLNTRVALKLNGAVVMMDKWRYILGLMPSNIVADIIIIDRGLRQSGVSSFQKDGIIITLLEND